jgi:head-tail adaptor
MIGGNITATLQRKNGSTTNAIGERIPAWKDIQTLTGWLDLQAGDSKYATHHAKLQESTHIFICDHVPVDRNANDKRLVVNGVVYDVMLIDNPMEMNQQLEIYLRFVG